jgi:hypothetical protein
VPTPKTLASLASLPGWTIDPDPVDPESRNPYDYPDARWTGHGVTIAITYEADAGDWDIRFGETGQMTLSHEYDSTEADAVAFALSLVAIATTAANALAAAAPPPPPTTIAELATRPGWRLDDGDAIHDQTDTIASPISVHLAGDQLWPGDERACAEAAYAVAAASEGSQARALAAATARMGQE